MPFGLGGYPGGMQVGPYTVLEVIARGGMGVVYRAEDAAGAQVALKVLLAQRAGSVQAQKRFQRELEALARLQHPHVVGIRGAGAHDGSAWLALEFVAGESLEARLRRGPLRIEEAVRVGRQLGQALSYVHACGLLHRDLKPANVLLEGERALLTDFGLVLDEQSEVSRITATGVFSGTPGYWAPEQARAERERIGPRTDVYGLGGVLFACLTGVPPVRAPSLQEYLQTVRFRSLSPPSVLRADVPPWLDALCMRCLDPDPDARPASADEVVRALTLGGGSAADGDTASRRAAPWVALVALGAVFAAGAFAWRAGTSPGPGAATDPHPDPAVAPDPDPTPGPGGKGTVEERVTALVQAAQEAFRGGRYADAVADMDRALDLDPQSAWAFECRGANEIELGRYTEALADLNRAVELQPDFPSAYTNLGTVKTLLGREADALLDFARALELDPNLAESWYGRGEALRVMGQFRSAYEDFTRALELKPELFKAYGSRALCAVQLGLHEAAIEDCGRLLLGDPGSALAYQARGEARINLGRPAEALADLDRALELEPDDLPALVNRAVAKEQLKRHDEAIEDCDRALALDPGFREALVARAVNKALGGRLADALLDYEQLLESDPSDGGSWLNRALCHSGLAQHEAAVTAFDQAFALGEGDAGNRVLRAQSLEALGRFAEAVAGYDEALSLGLPEGLVEQVRQLRARAAQGLE